MAWRLSELIYYRYVRMAGFMRRAMFMFCCDLALFVLSTVGYGRRYCANGCSTVPDCHRDTLCGSLLLIPSCRVAATTNGK